VADEIESPTDLTPEESELIVASRRRRRRLRVVALVAAVSLVLPAAAVAISAGFRTGIFAGTEDVVQIPDEEFLNLSHPSIVEVVQAEAAKVPLPPGADFDPVLARYPAKEEGAIGRKAVIVGDLELYAQCRWYRSWLRGDPEIRARDLKVIEQFPNWEFVKQFAPGDSGPQLVRDTVDQVRRGEETLVRQFIAANC
jgi:hypothetical protein